MPIHLRLSDQRLAVLRRMLLLTIIAFLLGIILATQPPRRGFAQGTTVILIQPSSSDINVEDTVTVDIRIEDVTDLYGVDIRLSFDHTVLEVQDADSNPANGIQIQKSAFPDPDCVIKNEADNDAGTIWYAVTQLNPTEPANGSGVTASVTFKGLADGISPAAFTYKKLVKRDGEPITTTAQSGQITVAPPTAIALSSLTAQSSPDLKASSVFPCLVWVAMLATGGVLWVRRWSNRPGRTGENSN